MVLNMLSSKSLHALCIIGGKDSEEEGCDDGFNTLRFFFLSYVSKYAQIWSSFLTNYEVTSFLDSDALGSSLESLNLLTLWFYLLSTDSWIELISISKLVP